MRLYAIAMYLTILNLVFGFIATAITLGWFMPDAQGVITMPSTDMFTSSLNTLENSTKSLQNLSGLEWVGVAVLTIPTAIATGFTFLLSMFTSAPDFILYIIQSVGIQLPSELANALSAILKVGLLLLTLYSAIQILSGKWFSFVE